MTLTLVGVLTASVTGCSGETTKVAEGDAATRRKNKDDALDRMSNPFGTAPKTAAGKAKGKSRPGASKKEPNVPLHLP